MISHVPPRWSQHGSQPGLDHLAGGSHPCHGLPSRAEGGSGGRWLQKRELADVFILGCNIRRSGGLNLQGLTVRAYLDRISELLPPDVGFLGQSESAGSRTRLLGLDLRLRIAVLLLLAGEQPWLCLKAWPLCDPGISDLPSRLSSCTVMMMGKKVPQYDGCVQTGVPPPPQPHMASCSLRGAQGGGGTKTPNTHERTPFRPSAL